MKKLLCDAGKSSIIFNTSFPLLAFSFMFPTFFFTKSGAYSQVSIKRESKTDQIRNVNKRSNLSSGIVRNVQKKGKLGMFNLPEVV